jgi:hypothetical protein
MMRQLSEEELKSVQRAIAQREITAAELLMEIYDHFISHLEGFSEEDFEEQLFELEQKFTYNYCHALQSKFSKSIRVDISKTQWRVVRSYFSTSRWIYASCILAVLFFVTNQTQSEKEVKILLLSPLILLTMIWFAFIWRVAQKIRPIKRTFKDLDISISSSIATPFSERIYLPVLLAQVLIYFPRLFAFEVDLNPILPGIAAVITAILTLYILSLLEVWKIKSKTALI